MDEHTPVPWPATMAARIRAGDQTLLMSGHPPLVDCRVLSEANYQLARRCVNAHDDLLATSKWMLEFAQSTGAAWVAIQSQDGASEGMARFRAAIANAEAQP